MVKVVKRFFFSLSVHLVQGFLSKGGERWEVCSKEGRGRREGKFVRKREERERREGGIVNCFEFGLSGGENYFLVF